jgi:hypothetical protein
MTAMSGSDRFLRFDLEGVCHAVANQIDAVGWQADRSARPEGFPAGPTVYLCDYEAQSILLIQTVIGGLETLQSWAAQQRLTFQDACTVLGVLMDRIGRGEQPLDTHARRRLCNSAALYLAGTQTYARAQQQSIEQFLVIRYEDISLRERILRPGVLGGPGPLSPAQISAAVLAHLAIDRKRHPERFRIREALRFRSSRAL